MRSPIGAPSRHVSICLVLIAVLILLAVGLSCDRLRVTDVYENGAVVSSSPIATQIGLNVLNEGGNAFDAAVAVGFALAVSHPQAGNIGGGGFAVVRDAATGEIRALDFRETAPEAATTNMYLDDSGRVINGASTFGAAASGVPGTVAGLYDLWDTYGSLDWEQLVKPAVELADTGFVVDAYLHGAFSASAGKLRQFEETADQFLPRGNAPAEGDRFIQKDLSRSLNLIASEGKSAFYEGEIGRLIVASMARHDGLIDSADLAEYQTKWREPIHFQFDSLDIYSMPPPSSGGIIMGQILKLLEPYDLSAMSPRSGAYIHLFCEACRLAYADRSKYLGDPDFYDVPNGLLSSEYLKQRRLLIDTSKATPSDMIAPGTLPGGKESTETTHYSVVDGEGNVVTITYTINSSFGNGLVVEGVGFLLNNEMDDFSVKPGVPNIYGLVGSEANKIEPRKRMLSSMAPTIILKHDQPYLTLGAKGGSQIITSLAAVILHLERFGMTPYDALAFPRYHHQWLPDRIFLEEGGFDSTVVQDLIRRGHQIKQGVPDSEVHLIEIEDGMLIPQSDPHTRGTGQGGI